MIHFSSKRDRTMFLISSIFFHFFRPPTDLQMICGFSCEDLISMFKELKSLGVVVKELSNELRQLVSNSELFEDGVRLFQIAYNFIFNNLIVCLFLNPKSF